MSTSDARFAELVQGHLDEHLSLEQQQELAAALDDPGRRAGFLQQLRVAGWLTAAAASEAGGDELVRRVQGELRATRDA